MGAPNITIAFYEQAIASIKRGDKGILAMILVNASTEQLTVDTILDSTDIPESYSAANIAQVKYALIGYQNTPKKIIAVAIPSAEDYDDALEELTNYDWDYLVAPTCSTDGKAADISTWIKAQRSNNNKIYKAVLPNQKADSEAIVNVTMGYTDAEGNELTAEAACARVAGIICGTPWSMSCTYAPLSEALGCPAKSQEEIDTAVDAGELIFMWDGEKVKIVRGVTSFTTTSQDKGDSYKKIKLVEIMDLIQHDIRKTAEDSYIGKYNNSYNNKNLLTTAIGGYFDTLISDNILASGSCELDVDAQRTYIKAKGGKFVIDGETVSLEDATELQIKQANTGSQVFLKCTISMLDALEDISIKIYI